ncbi:MAG: hypothetical protein JOZ62_23850 [Acidobacteriaceae bacterium]|nr:hypothetical protein [Acidobacteriaceae bacterium]
MNIHSGLRFPAGMLSLALAASLCLAVDTHIWEQSDQSDFTRGTPKHLSIRSDGHLTLAPAFKELDSTTVPYLWAMAQDSKGTLYYAGGAPTGATARIFALAPGGKARSFADVPGLEIHALAVDAQDRLYAAVLPDAKVYRIDKAGKPQLLFDVKCKYIWAMVFDRSGNLFIGTGDSGVIYEITPDGKGREFAHTAEAHVRSLTIDAAGNVIAGTEPSGLVLRISPEGQSFVLFQTGKREVTAVAEREGAIYATGVGTKPATVTGPAPVLPSTPAAVSATGTPRIGTAPPAPAPPVGSLSAAVTGGSELYRIQKDGFPERLWESSSDIAYAIAFDSAGHPLVGTGNKGIIYRIDSDQLSTQLLNAPPTQVTAFLEGRNGVLYAATGNVGNVYSIGPGLESTGALESEVLDANTFAYWGKAHITSTANGGSLTLEARSGNLNNPQHDWSAWSRVGLSDLGGQIEAPAARFLQYRLTLSRSSSGPSPEVSVVDIPYLPKNVAPKVRHIEMGPFNYREAPASSSLERTVMPSGSPATISLPAIGQRKSAPATSSAEPISAATLQYSKGFITARWSASDSDGDSLIFKVEIKGSHETRWRLLKDKLQDRYYAFDSSSFADGEYVIRVTASDAPGNAADNALSSSLISDPFIIDNTPPEIAVRSITKEGPHCVLAFTAKDALSWIDKAEYSVNGGEWRLLLPVNKLTDSRILDYRLEADAGQLIAIRVFDEDDNVSVKQMSLQ